MEEQVSLSKSLCENIQGHFHLQNLYSRYLWEDKSWAEWQKQKHLFLLSLMRKGWWCESWLFCNAFPSPLFGVLILSISYVNFFKYLHWTVLKYITYQNLKNTANRAHTCTVVEVAARPVQLLNESKGRLEKAATGFLLLLITSDHVKKKVTVNSNTAWSPLALGWGNETSPRRRTPTKKCEKLKWQGCVDSLLNEWREWIEIYIYIAPFIYSVLLRTKDLEEGLLWQHSCTGEWSGIGPNIIFPEPNLQKQWRRVNNLCKA